MNTDALSFLSDELPENWEKVLEREKTIRNQHMIDVENVARRSFETGTISKYTPVRTLMSHFLPDITTYIENAVKIQYACSHARRRKEFRKRLSEEPYVAYVYIALIPMIDGTAQTKSTAVSCAVCQSVRTCTVPSVVWPKATKFPSIMCLISWLKVDWSASFSSVMIDVPLSLNSI